MPPDARLTSALAERYALEGELGQGGMATVYLARDVKHDRQVALKVLRPELAALLGRDRFLSEIRLTAKLDHPHILTLLDSGESDGFLWYTLPYIRGESLRHKLDRETQLSVDEAVSITRQIAGALEHAHQHGIIHRDVKPENILLHEGEAMLADFGIALAVKEAGGKRLTETGLAVGTVQYMSPEQATAERTLDARSDVYSLGAVLYEMLAGEPPFTGATGQAVIAKLMVQEAMRLRIVRKAIPVGLEAVVARALAKVPADRFPSAAAFAEALAAPEAHRAPGRGPKRALVLGAAALVVLVLAGVWLAPRLGSRKSSAVRGRPTLKQATLTGNAFGPALSPDGKELAYLAETCGTPRQCTRSVRVADLTLGEEKVLAEVSCPALAPDCIYGLTWSPDGRFLLFYGPRGVPTVNGDFLLSLFGSREQYLGDRTYGGRFLVSSDTIIANAADNGIIDRSKWGTTRWFMLVSRSGSLLDSIPFVLPGGYPSPFPSPDGGRILVHMYTPGDDRIYLLDRQGRVTDSLPLPPRFHPQMGMQWTASGDGVLMLVPDTGGVWNLLRYPVSAQGKVRLPPDTAVADLRADGTPDFDGYGIAMSPPSRRGDLAIALLTQRAAVTTLERRTTGTQPSRTGRLFPAVTGRLDARISPDGERVLVAREAPLEGGRAFRLELWPYSGGTGSPFGTTRKGWGNFRWSQDGRIIYQLVETGTPGAPEHLATDVASGQVLWRRPVPDTLPWIYQTDSLLLYVARQPGQGGTPLEWRSYPRGGQSPLVFSFLDSSSSVMAGIVSQDGRGSWQAAIITSGAVRGDSLSELLVARPGVPAVRVMQIRGPYTDLSFLRARPDPVFEVMAEVAEGGLRWLRLEPGRPPRDLGPMPRSFFGASYSTDGRRGVVIEREPSRDIWLMRWPGEDSALAGGGR